MARPNVNINLGNGNLGRVAASADGVAALMLTGATVADKLVLNKPYFLSSTRDLTTLGITAENNALADKEVRAFYAQAGEGATLYLIVVAEATTMTAMCDPAADSPLCKLIDFGAGDIRLVGVNKIAPAEYSDDATQGIDGDTITAAAAAQKCAEAYAKKIRPFRVLIAAPNFKADAESLFEPRSASYNRVGIVLTSDDIKTKTAAIGMVLGRAAKIEPQQSIGRVADGSIAPMLYLTNGRTFTEMDGMADMLHDDGYIFPLGYPTKNGAYLNDDPTAAPVTDDYAQLSLGRIIDKASTVAYDTYITSILDTISIEDDGTLPVGVCVSYAAMLENALNIALKGQVSSISVSIDPVQNILSSGIFEINCSIVPLATLRQINVNLGFSNPALNQ